MENVAREPAPAGFIPSRLTTSGLRWIASLVDDLATCRKVKIEGVAALCCAALANCEALDVVDPTDFEAVEQHAENVLFTVGVLAILLGRSGGAPRGDVKADAARSYYLRLLGCAIEDARALLAAYQGRCTTH